MPGFNEITCKRKIYPESDGKRADSCHWANVPAPSARRAVPVHVFAACPRGGPLVAAIFFQHFGACCLVTAETCLSCGLNRNMWKEMNSALPVSTARHHSPKGTRQRKSSFYTTGRFERIRSINALVFLPETSLREDQELAWKRILATYVTAERFGHLSVTLLHLDT